MTNEMTEAQIKVAARKLYIGRGLNPDIRCRMVQAEKIIKMRLKAMEQDDIWDAIDYAQQQDSK